MYDGKGERFAELFESDHRRVWVPLTRNPGKNPIEQNKSGTGGGPREVLVCHSDDDGATWS